MLEKLKEYKELISIIVFFLGGFIWLNSQFPTKSNLETEIASVYCLLEKYMTLTQLQVRGQELEKQTDMLMKRISEVLPDDSSDNSPPLSPAMRLEFEQLKSDLAGRKNDLRTTTSKMKQIQDELARNVCRKVKA